MQSVKNKNILNKVIVVDFGSQTTQLIVRRVREIGVYCELISHLKLSQYIKTTKPSALILSGGPASSFKKRSPKIDKKILNLDIPVLGICYGMQIICQILGGVVKSTNKREFGRAEINIITNNLLFKDINKIKKTLRFG